MDNDKRISLPSEVIYLIALLGLSFSVAMASAANLGLSMVAAPAYIISQKLTFLTYGQAEYLFQGIVFILICIIIRKFKFIYLSSFLTCLIYGGFLDLWRLIIPLFNPNITAPGSMDLWLSILLFTLSTFLTAFTVMLFLKTYLYPQVIDFSVKAFYSTYHTKVGLTKTIFDAILLLLSIVLTLSLFQKFVGIGVGTIIVTLINGTLIGLFGKLFDHFFVAKPIFPKFAALFEI